MIQHRLVAMLAAVALAVFTGTALAGNGNGNGSNGHGNSANAPGHQQQASQPAAPAAQAAPATQPAPADNHATPPGQAKKQAAPAAQPTAAQSASAPATKHGHQNKQSSTSAAQPATGGSNAQGVKPSNTTKHDTYAKASSNQTKQYGNGKTAGQIATQAGFGDATLHGPGNSQPHKTAPCPGGHEVDVHALKHKSAKCGAMQSAAQPETSHAEQAVKHEEQKQAEKSEVQAATEQKVESQPCTGTQTVTEQVLVGVKHMIGPKGSGRFVLIHPNAHSAHFTGKHPEDVPVFETVTKTIATPAANCASSQAQATAAPAAPAPAAAVASAQVASAPAAPAGAAAAQAASAPASSAPMAATPAAAGGVKGAVVALKPTKTKPAGGVLGRTTRLGGTVASSKLPFTGLPLWIFALAALALITFGLTVRRASAKRM